MTHTRQDDEQVLRILGAFRSGETYGQIGNREGMGRNRVAGIIFRVKTADAKHARLNSAEITRHYERGEI